MEESSEVFEFRGLSFRGSIHRDEFMGAPWEEHDGHGIVSEWTSRGKKPGERVLAGVHGSYRFYDFAETIKVARRDGWGVAEHAGKTEGQIAAEAVQADYERLKAWCDDEWYWVFVSVELLDVNGNAVPGYAGSLSGIESDAGDYFREVREELAGEIASGLDGKNEVCLKIRKVADASD